MKKTILISGINGFLASNLAKSLKSNYNVFGIAKKGDQLNDISIFSTDEIEKIELIPDFIILCHATVSSGQITMSNKLLFDVNVDITERIINLFTTSKIIYISSASIYALNSFKIEEDSPINPQTEYAISKLWAEKIVLKSRKAVVLRFSSIFGVGMKENTIIPNYINQALKNGIIEVWGEGSRKQNYISIIDACNFINVTIKNFDLVRNKILLAVSQKEYSNKELAQIIAFKTNSQLIHVNIDNSISIQYHNMLTCQLLNWEPKSNFKQDIHNYIKWKIKQF